MATSVDSPVRSAIGPCSWLSRLATPRPSPLVVFAEGSTSLYFSSGGGIIGAGDYESVRATHGPFFAEAEARLDAFSSAMETPLPTRGRVRFYLRTFRGTLTAEADEEDLGEMRHPLSALFNAGQRVISAVREASGED